MKRQFSSTLALSFLGGSALAVAIAAPSGPAKPTTELLGNTFAPPSVPTRGNAVLPEVERVERVARDFVSKLYIHGMPYGQARDLGPAAVPILAEFLSRDDMKETWVNAITAIAFIGDPSGHQILNDFIWSRFSGEVDLSTFRALVAAQGVLGYIAAYDVPTLYRELEVGVDPAAWSRLPWKFRHYEGEPLHVLWSKLSITAISHTGSSQAVTLLQELQQRPLASTQVPNIDEGLERLTRIQSVGLDALMRQVEQEVKASFESKSSRGKR